MKVLLTGGAGFLGHHVVDYLLKHTDWHLTLIDRLDYSGNLNRLAELPIDRDRVNFVYHDLKAPINGQVAHRIGENDYVLHFAAATHVDRSIEDPLSFVMDNVVGTCNLLNFVREAGCNKFIMFSTDEVFGPAANGVAYKEDDRYRSGNPYAATKAGAEELCIAYANTYNMPIIATHCMNIVGERQHPEKFIPMTIARVLRGEKVFIHADRTRTIPGSRFYIHASNVADAIFFLLGHSGIEGQKFNIVGEKEVDNFQLALFISQVIGKPLVHEFVDFHSSRPGHDLRYALCGKKMASMGWKLPQSFEQSMEQTVRWTLANPHWLATGIEKRRAA